MSTRRPNFLFFIADQLRADHLGCYGHPTVRTPNIDAIAARGARFDRCYVASAVCQPNRVTLMTGRMPSLHGTQQNGIPLDLGAVCFTHLLRAQGWKTALFGKAHFQNFTGAPSRFQLEWPPGLIPPPPEWREQTRGLRTGPGYDRELGFDASEDPAADEGEGDFYGFDRFRVCTWHGDSVRGHYSAWLRERMPEADVLRGSVPPRFDPTLAAPQVRPSRLPEHLYPTHYVADETIAFLEACAQDPTHSPFFVQCSFPDPHHPFTPPERHASMYDPDAVVLPESFHRRPHDPPPMLTRLHDDRMRGARRLDDWVAPYAVTEAEARRTIAATWGMVTLIDEAVGRVMRRLEALGLAEDTVVVFTSDHGDWMGDHGVMLKGPMHYQGLIRAPLLWAEPTSVTGPSVPRGIAVGSLASSLDVARSLLARAGLAAGHGMQGQDLAECMRFPGRSAHDCVIVEHQTSRPFPGNAGRVRVRTMTDGRWRMSIWDGLPFAELYDLEADPHELVNRWNDPVFSGRRAELVERMLRQTISLQERAPFPVAEA